nr:MAG TPA: hypothetical protein [Caudoviricetes sp.]
MQKSLWVRVTSSMQKGGKILEIPLKAIYYRCVGIVELCGG